MSRIRLSEKHGVNPALGVCYLCGENNGEVLLLGRLPGDAEAPRKVVSGHPCKRCEEALKVGCALWESTSPDSADRTGRVCVVKDEAIRRIFSPELAEAIIRQRHANIEPEAYNYLTRKGDTPA